MPQNNVIVRVGVQTIVSYKNSILLGKRKNGFQEGSWGLPGGHLEPGETILQAAARELAEETGLIAKKMRLFCVTDPTPESNYHMQIGVMVEEFEGVVQIIEPHKCSDLRFYEIKELPEPLFVSSKQVINNFINGKLYVEHKQ